MITLNHVWKVYRTGEVETAVLRDCNVQIGDGEFLAVMGVSGSGKSTLLNLIGGLDTVTRGEVRIDGRDLAGASKRELTEFRRRTIGFVFQFYNLLPTLTARENVEMGAELRGLRGAAARRQADFHLDLLGLSAAADLYPAHLSGGQQQRVAIARALAKEPTVLLADEPTGNLDSAAGEEVTRLLDRVHREMKMTLIVVTHNPQLASHGDRTVRIVDGSITEDPARRAPTGGGTRPAAVRFTAPNDGREPGAFAT